MTGFTPGGRFPISRIPRVKPAADQHSAFRNGYQGEILIGELLSQLHGLNALGFIGSRQRIVERLGDIRVIVTLSIGPIVARHKLIAQQGQRIRHVTRELGLEVA